MLFQAEGLIQSSLLVAGASFVKVCFVIPCTLSHQNKVCADKNCPSKLVQFTDPVIFMSQFPPHPSM